jgi:hypothetical protein
MDDTEYLAIGLLVPSDGREAQIGAYFFCSYRFFGWKLTYIPTATESLDELDAANCRGFQLPELPTARWVNSLQMGRDAASCFSRFATLRAAQSHRSEFSRRRRSGLPADH